MEPRITIQDVPKGMFELLLNIETYLSAGDNFWFGIRNLSQHLGKI